MRSTEIAEVAVPYSEVLDRDEQFLALKCEWEQLYGRCPQATLFQSYDWARVWWEALAEHRQYVVALRSEDCLTGVVALMNSRSRFLKAFPVRRLEVVAGYESSHDSVLFGDAPRAHLEALLSKLVGRGDWDILTLTTQEEAGASGGHLAEVCHKLNLRLVDNRNSASPYLPLPANVDDFWKGMDSKFRSFLRNHERKLAAMGPLTHEVFDASTPNLETTLDRLFAISRKGWAHADGTAIGSTDALCAYYGGLARVAQKNGWLMLHILRVGDQDAAFEFNLFEKGVMYNLKLGFDPQWKAGSPGQVLKRYVIEDAIRRGAHEYDMLGISDPYKMKWTEKTRPRYKWLVFRPGVYGGFLHALQTRVWEPIRARRGGDHHD